LEHVSYHSSFHMPQHLVTLATQALLQPTEASRSDPLIQLYDNLMLHADNTGRQDTSTLHVGKASVVTPKAVLMTNVHALLLNLKHDDMHLSLSTLMPPYMPNGNKYVEHHVVVQSGAQQTLVHNVHELNRGLGRRVVPNLPVLPSESHRSRRVMLKQEHNNMIRNLMPLPAKCECKFVTTPSLLACQTQIEADDLHTQHTNTFYTLCLA
jgi:hypothetical protein